MGKYFKRLSTNVFNLLQFIIQNSINYFVSSCIIFGLHLNSVISSYNRLVFGSKLFEEHLKYFST